MLERAPNHWTNDQHEPLFGAYEGVFSEVNLGDWGEVSGLPWWQRAIRHKRWFYASVATSEVLLVSAMVNAGVATSAFVYVIDLVSEQVLFEQRYLGVPGPGVYLNNKPGAGFKATALLPGVKATCVRASERAPYWLDISGLGVKNWRPQGLKVRAHLYTGEGGDALSLVAPVGGVGRVNITQKWAAMPASGELKIGNRSFLLDGGVGGIDYTNGILDRRTRWRWAMGHGRDQAGNPLGFNLVEGFNEGASGSSENALWVGGKLWPLPQVQFAFNPEDHRAPWRIFSDDGRVALSFRAIHVHREPFALGTLVRSHFVQPAGRFDGFIKLPSGEQVAIEGIPGVTEDQDMIW